MSKQKPNTKKDDEKSYAWLATFLSIMGFVIVLITRRENKYVMFYAKQSLAVFIIGAILGIAAKILLFIPIIGVLINLAVWIFILLIWLMSWVNALSGKEKATPFAHRIAESISL